MRDSKHAIIHEGDIIRSIVQADVRFRVVCIDDMVGAVIGLRVNKDGEVYKGAIDHIILDDALETWWEVEL